MKFASVELKTRGRLRRKPQLDLVIFKSGEGFFFDFFDCKLYFTHGLRNSCSQELKVPISSIFTVFCHVSIFV